MRMLFLSLLVFSFAIPAVAQEPVSQKIPLHVLYLAQSGDDARRQSFESLLDEHFARVTVGQRDAFEASQAGDADVVVLDWSQSEDREDGYPSPLGDLENWNTPTVLLSSAGLLMAGPWNVMGGAG